MIQPCDVIIAPPKKDLETMVEMKTMHCTTKLHCRHFLLRFLAVIILIILCTAKKTGVAKMLAIINSIDRRHFSTSFGDNAVLAAAADTEDLLTWTSAGVTAA